MRSIAGRFACALTAAVGFGALWQAQSVRITTKDIQAGLADPTRWLSVAGDYTGQRHSPLRQITYSYQTGGNIFAPPTTYMVDGRQYVAIPSATTVTAFTVR